MKGKIKNVRRDIGFIESTEDHWKSDVHPVRITRTWAETYDGNEIDIDEDEIRSHYNRKHLTKNTIERLDRDLHNRWVEHEDGVLSERLEEYI